MPRLKLLIRNTFLALLGLLGLAFLAEGLWFIWHDGSGQGVVMIMAIGGMLAGCAWWLLFRAPQQAAIVRTVLIRLSHPPTRCSVS